MNLNHKRTLCSGVTVLFLALFSITADAEPFGSGGGRPPGPMDLRPHPMSFSNIWQDPKVVQDLGLTDDQIRGLKDVNFMFKERHLELKAQLDRLHLQMEKSLSMENVDEAAVRETAQKIADVMGKLFVQDIESHLTTEKLLTSEQRKKMKMRELCERPKGMGPPVGLGGKDPGRP